MPATHMDALEETFTEDRGMTATRRCGKVRTARQRLGEGWYDSDELLDTVLDAILNDVARR